jgi:hypothetical protein
MLASGRAGRSQEKPPGPGLEPTATTGSREETSAFSWYHGDVADRALGRRARRCGIAVNRGPARINGLGPGATGVEREQHARDAEVEVRGIRADAGLQCVGLRARRRVAPVIQTRDGDLRPMRIDGDRRLVLVVARGLAGRAADADVARPAGAAPGGQDTAVMMPALSVLRISLTSIVGSIEWAESPRTSRARSP